METIKFDFQRLWSDRPGTRKLVGYQQLIRGWSQDTPGSSPQPPHTGVTPQLPSRPGPDWPVSTNRRPRLEPPDRQCWARLGCTFYMRNLRPADSGNYLSNFQYTTPGFKLFLVVEGEFPILGVLIICLVSFLLLTMIYLFVQRKTICIWFKEILKRFSCSEKVTKAESKDQQKVSILAHVA